MYLDIIAQKLAELVHQRQDAPHAHLFTAARYALLAPGKRLRPRLTLATATDFAAPLENALMPACALEMVHTYSLIHDDLPCMDDDDLRRGLPTLHKVYDEGHAMLTGDFLLTYAFEVLTKAPGLSAEQKLELIALLATSAGAEGMLAGQTVDLAATGKDIDWATLQFMHHHKTGALIAAAIDFGAIVAQVNNSDRQKLQTFGKHFGLAFQIIDDILDATSTPEILGKPIGSDAKNGKPTALSLLGLPQAHALADEHCTAAITTLASLPRPTPALYELAQQLANRNR